MRQCDNLQILINNKFYPLSWFITTIVILISSIVIFNSINSVGIDIGKGWVLNKDRIINAGEIIIIRNNKDKLLIL